jgi:hypothetical protein
LAGEPPYKMGWPGFTNWLMTRLLTVSAVCWTGLPTRVTGAMNPESGIETNLMGIDQRAQSTRFWLVTSLHLMGAVGQQEKMASGLARSRTLRMPAQRVGEERLQRALPGAESFGTNVSRRTQDRCDHGS